MRKAGIFQKKCTCGIRFDDPRVHGLCHQLWHDERELEREKRKSPKLNDEMLLLAFRIYFLKGVLKNTKPNSDK